MTDSPASAAPRWVGGAPTVQARMNASGGHTRGFDYLRLVLALGVVAIHSVVTTRDGLFNGAFWSGPWRPLIFAVLPMFFALSGFLVTGSLLRSATIFEFVVLRGLRILPALAVEILLSALIIGPLLTTVPWAQYFSDAKFWTYLLNIVGSISYALPGLFADNTRPYVVNLSLWTVPVELWCYIYLVALAVLSIVRRKIWFIVGALAMPLVFTARLFWTGHFLAPDAVAPGYFLIACFMMGVAFQLARDWLPLNPLLLIASVLLTVFLLPSTSLVYLAAAPLTYITVYLGLLNPKKTFLLSGDYSYGIYLFAFPIQQALVESFPSLREPELVFVIASIASFIYAMASWHGVEKRVLQRRRQIVEWVNGLVAVLRGRLLQAFGQRH